MTLSTPGAIAPLLSAISVLLLLAAPIDEALAQTREIKLTGMGVRKCSEWLQWKEAGNAESRAMTLEWARGFMAGHNVYARSASGAATPVVAGVGVMIPLLDAFCKKNPDERILAGVVEITRELGGVKVDLAPKPTAPTMPTPAPQKDDKGRQES